VLPRITKPTTSPDGAAIAQVMALIGPYEIIFVDDGSSDGTLTALRAAARDPVVRYLSFTGISVISGATRGLRHAAGAP